MTRGELKTRVRRLLAETDSTGFYADVNDLDNVVDDAHKAVASDMESYVKVSQSLEVTGSTAYPDDCLRILNVVYQNRDLKPTDRAELNRLYRNTWQTKTADTPTHWLEPVPRYIRLYPTPTTEPCTVYLDYVAEPADFVNDDSQLVVPGDQEQLVVLKAVALALLEEPEYERKAQEFERMYWQKVQLQQLKQSRRRRGSRAGQWRVIRRSP